MELRKRWEETQIVKVPVGLIVRDGVGLTDLVAEGAGIAQIYDTNANFYIEDGRLVRLLGAWSSGQQPVYSVLPGRRNVPAKVRAFLEFAKALFVRCGAP